MFGRQNVMVSFIGYIYFYVAGPTDRQWLKGTIVFTNALQTANFSFNFLLYLAVNSQFRAAVAEVCRFPARLRACCRRLPITTLAITLETVLPTPAPPPSPAVTSTAAAIVVVETRNEGRPGGPGQSVGAVDVYVAQQAVTLNRRDDGNNDDDDDDEHRIGQC